MYAMTDSSFKTQLDYLDEKPKVELMLEDLQEVNLRIANLQAKKDAIIWKILDELKSLEYHIDDGKKVITNVSHEGQKTVVIGKFKATVTTAVDWKIDINEYLVQSRNLSPEFNPVKSEVKYSVNNRKLADLQQYGSDADKLAANSFLIKRFANPSIKLVPNA